MRRRNSGLERHAKNVRTHIRMLASKAYWDQFEESPEFVILFIPGDQFLSAALNEEPDLIEFALSQQIILATPTSFVALLKAVAYGWRQLSLAENAREIRTLAEDLHTAASHVCRAYEPGGAATGQQRRKLQQGRWLARAQRPAGRHGSSSNSASTRRKRSKSWIRSIPYRER